MEDGNCCRLVCFFPPSSRLFQLHTKEVKEGNEAPKWLQVGKWWQLWRLEVWGETGNIWMMTDGTGCLHVRQKGLSAMALQWGKFERAHWQGQGISSEMWPGTNALLLAFPPRSVSSLQYCQPWYQGTGNRKQCCSDSPPFSCLSLAPYFVRCFTDSFPPRFCLTYESILWEHLSASG